MWCIGHTYTVWLTYFNELLCQFVPNGFVVKRRELHAGFWPIRPWDMCDPENMGRDAAGPWLVTPCDLMWCVLPSLNELSRWWEKEDLRIKFLVTLWLWIIIFSMSQQKKHWKKWKLLVLSPCSVKHVTDRQQQTFTHWGQHKWQKSGFKELNHHCSGEERRKHDFTVRKPSSSRWCSYTPLQIPHFFRMKPYVIFSRCQREVFSSFIHSFDN